MKAGPPISTIGGAAWLVAAVALCAAGAAQAQTAAQSLDPSLSHRPAPAASGKADASHPALDLSASRSAFTAAYAPTDTPQMAGFAKTAIDHRFASDEVGSVGYLCGMHRSANETNGPASSYEPVGTFLGAQLKYAF